MFQTDFPEIISLHDYGCLFMSLLDIVEEDQFKQFSRQEILKLYDTLNDSGVLGSVNSPSEYGAYVYDHVKVLNKVSGEIWKYVGRIYTKAEEERNKKSFGTHVGATHSILQIQTKNMGHFRRLDYDPWGSGTSMLYLKSVRYYVKL